MGNIRWSAVAVNAAMGKVEKEIEPIFEPLWRADKIVRDAMEIPNLPDYMKQALSGVQYRIHEITGMNLDKYGSQILGSIHYVRGKIPEGAIEAETAATKHGVTGNIFAR
jgi:hypothetical protein